MIWNSLEPFLNPVQVRILVALRGGPKTRDEIGRAVGRERSRISVHIAKLLRWDLVGWDRRVGAWSLVRTWDATVAELEKRMRHHLEGAIIHLDELRTASLPDEPVQAAAAPDFHGGGSFRRERMRYGGAR